MSSNFYDQNYYRRLETDGKIKRIPIERRRELQFRKNLICPKAGKTLLDLGCGIGEYLASLKDTRADLWGIDISKNAIDYAKKIVPNPTQIICGNACPLPFKDNNFDYLTAWGTVEHFPDIPLILKEITRVIKNKGKAVIMVPNIYYYKFIWDSLRRGSGPTKHQEIEFLYAFKEWKDLIEKSGLSVLKTAHHNKFTKHPLLISLRNMIIPFYLSNHFVFICTKEN